MRKRVMHILISNPRLWYRMTRTFVHENLGSTIEIGKRKEGRLLVSGKAEPIYSKKVSPGTFRQ
jgi:hypothetical protein